MGFLAYTQFAVTRCERCASYVAITPPTPTCSFPNAAGQSVPSVSTGSFSASARPPRCHSRSTRTCFAMPVDTSSPTMATTRGRCSTTSGTRTFSTRSGTPKWLPIGSKIFGKTERYAFGSISRSAASMPPWHPVRSRPRRRWHLARLALPRADRGVGLQHHSVLGFGRIEQRAALYLYGYRFYRPLDHFCRRASLRCKRGLDVLDHGFKLLVRQVFERIAVLDLVLAGN